MDNLLICTFMMRYLQLEADPVSDGKSRPKNKSQMSDN